MSRHVVCSALVVATLTLAVCSVQTQNEHRPAAHALADLRASAEAGDAEAQFILGGLNVTGVGVPQDAAAAVAWYRRAAAEGDATAQSNLGRMYDQGVGVPPDAAEAVAWYRRAAAQGDATAQNNLGAMYAEGLGVPPDAAAAVAWYRRAAEQGHTRAQYNLGGIAQGARVGWFDNPRAGTEHMIQEANHEAGLAVHPSGRIDINRNHFPLGMERRAAGSSAGKQVATYSSGGLTWMQKSECLQ